MSKPDFAALETAAEKLHNAATVIEGEVLTMRSFATDGELVDVLTSLLNLCRVLGWYAEDVKAALGQEGEAKH